MTQPPEDDSHVRVVGGATGWVPSATPPPAPKPPAAEPLAPTVLTPDALVRAVVGPDTSETEVVVASGTVEDAGIETGLQSTVLHTPVADTTTVLPAESTTVVRSRHGAQRWAPVASGAVGTLVVLVGLLLGGAAAYAYGDPTACAAYAKAHAGSQGFGCTAWQRKGAVIAPMIGLPLLVVGWLAWMWVPERSASTRIRQALGLLAALVVITVLAVLGIRAAVR